MGQLPVAARARGGQLPVQFAPPDLHLPLALGHLPALFASLDPAPLVAVGRVVGPALPVELAVQPAQRFGVRSHFGTERLEERCLQGRHRDSARSQVQPDNPTVQLMLELLVGRALAHQLSVEAVPLAELAADQPHVLDRAGEPVGLHRIVRIQSRLKLQSPPLHPVPAPAGAAGGGLALHRVELVPTLEPDPASLAQQQPVGGAVGPSGQCLDRQAVQVRSQPGVPELLGVGVQRILRKAVLSARASRKHSFRAGSSRGSVLAC